MNGSLSREVFMEGLALGRGSGRSKKEAEQQAAAVALDRLKTTQENKQ